MSNICLQTMPVQPIDLLELSKQLMVLNSGQDDECIKRCVVSRAYYAALHAVDTTFSKADVNARVNGESSHAEIIGRAVARGNQVAVGRTSARTIANMMPRLRRFRNSADYKISENFNDQEYLDVVARAQRVLDLCNEFNVLNTAEVAQLSIKSDVDDSLVSTSAVVGERPSLKRVK